MIVASIIQLSAVNNIWNTWHEENMQIQTKGFQDFSQKWCLLVSNWSCYEEVL